MHKTSWRLWLLGALAVAAIAAAFFVAPIAQDPAYHQFADRRTLLGTPNFCNVFSNLGFLLVGVFGLSRRSAQWPSSLRLAYLIFCAAVVLVGIGSAYYHYAPSTAALVWDRLPMTVAFMTLFALLIRERISERIGNALLWPLLLAGVASVGFWYWSELQGRGDLRPYALVQFLPMLLIPLMLALFPGDRRSTNWLWGTLGIYVLAKVTEHFDQAIYASIAVFSGHSLKHVLAAIAVLFAVFALQRFDARQ